MTLTYKKWYDIEGAELQEDIENWIENCPTNNALVVPSFDMDDFLLEEFEARVSDLQDRAYDAYKDSLYDC